MAQTLPKCPDCSSGYQPDDNYCRQCGMFLAALRDTAIVAATPALPERLPRQRAALPAPVKKAAAAMAVGTALQIGVSLTGKYLAKQAGKQALNAVTRPKQERVSRRRAREVAPAKAVEVDPYPHAAAVSETVVIRRVWLRKS